MIGSVRGRRLFADLRSNGFRTRRGALRMTYLPVDSATGPQLAFALGRRFGTAVERNRARRRVRAAFVETWSDPGTVHPAPGAYLLSGNRRLLSDDFAQIKSDIASCLQSVVDHHSDHGHHDADRVEPAPSEAAQG